jgi:hypothetical protein
MARSSTSSSRLVAARSNWRFAAVDHGNEPQLAVPKSCGRTERGAPKLIVHSGRSSARSRKRLALTFKGHRFRLLLALFDYAKLAVECRV